MTDGSSHTEKYRQRWKMHIGLRTTCTAIHFQEELQISVRQVQHLLEQHDFIVEKCWTDPKPRLNLLKTFGGSSSSDPAVPSSQNPISVKNETTFLSQTSSSWSPQFWDINRLLLKEEMLHSGKNGTLSNMRCFSAIKFKLSSDSIVWSTPNPFGVVSGRTSGI